MHPECTKAAWNREVLMKGLERYLRVRYPLGKEDMDIVLSPLSQEAPLSVCVSRSLMVPSHSRADWGPFRAIAQTNIYGRSGFFLNGGRWSGLAGCIDVGGGLVGNKAVQRLIELIRNSKQRIVLEVRV